MSLVRAVIVGCQIATGHDCQLGVSSTNMLRSMVRPKHDTCRFFEGNGRPRITGRVRKQRHRGQAFEVVLSLPILLIATLAILEIGILFLVQQTVTTAAGDGVREAAKVGATTGSIVSAVLRDLAVNNIKNSADYLIRIEYYGGSTATAGTYSPPPPLPPLPTLTANQVLVTVWVRPTNAANQPVPNWLSTLWCVFQNWAFQVSALAYLE